MSFGHLPDAFGGPAACPLNASRRPRLTLNQIFFWFQKATLSSRLPLNASRRPRLPLSPSRRPWRPSMSFGHLPDAFLDIFFWFQKATLGSRLPLNASRRCRLPLNQIFFWFQKATLGSRLPLNASRRPRLPLSPSRRPWGPSSMSFGHLPDAFGGPAACPLNASRRPRLTLNQIFFWFQKATLGSRLPLNASRRPIGCP